MKTYDEMKNGEMQDCPQCGTRRERGDFFFSRLDNNVRVCCDCSHEVKHVEYKV